METKYLEQLEKQRERMIADALSFIKDRPFLLHQVYLKFGWDKRMPRHNFESLFALHAKESHEKANQ